MINKFKINPAIPLAILITASAGAGLAFHLNQEKLVSGDLVPHEIGHEDIIPYLNFNVKSSDFVLLDAGSSKNLATLLFDQKIKYCNEKGIACGLIINSTAEKDYEIYNDIEYVKNLILKYNVNCPVYINIKEIMENKRLSNTEKQNLINIFIDKCSSNGIYVGIAGKDDLLQKAEKYLDIKESDVYVIMDNNQDYEGNYNVYKDEKGRIHATKDIAVYIKEKGLNKPSNFMKDKKVSIKSWEELEELAYKNNISIESLLKYNELFELLVKHQLNKDNKITIKLPTKQERILYGKDSYVTLEEPLMGCDISEMQGKDTDWNNMDFDFIIIRSNHGNTEDECFKYNEAACEENNIPIGVYCTNEVYPKKNESKEEFMKRFNEQIETTLNTIKDSKIKYPVFFDLETLDNFTDETLIASLNAWKDKMNENGYISGIYANQSVTQKIINIDNTVPDNFELWIAGGPQYTEDKKDIDISEVKPAFDEIEITQATLNQVTDSCINAGAKNSEGHLAIDYSLEDFENPIITEESLKLYEIKEFNKIESKIPIGISGIGIIGLATIGIGKIRHKIKTKKR